MKRSRYLFLILTLISGVVLGEQPTPPPDEGKMVEAVQKDFKEGMFNLAQIHSKDFLRKFPGSSHCFEVQLIQAKSLYFLGQYQPALASLTVPTEQVPAKLRSDYLFWEGEILLQLEKWGEAEKKYRELIDLLPEKNLLESAQLGLAWSLFKQNKEEDAHKLLDTLVSKQGKDPAGQKASIFLARILISRAQYKDATLLLETLLVGKPPLGVEVEADYWLGEIAQADNRLADAIDKYSAVTENLKAFPRSLVAQSWFSQGTCEQKLNPPQYDKAMQCFEQAYTIGDDEKLKYNSFEFYLGSAQSLQRLPEAQTHLRDFAQQAQKNGDTHTAAAALYAIGSSQATDKQSDQAIGTLEAMLTAYPDTIWRVATNYQLANLYQDKGNLYQDKNQYDNAKIQYDNALKAYQACLDSGASADITQQVVSKMGEVYFVQNDLIKAATNFQKSATFGGALAESALFNLILVQAKRDDLEGFTAAETQFDEQFPKSSFQARVILEKARLLERKGQLDKARQTYQDALGKNLDPAQRPFFLLRLGDLLYDAGQYEESLNMFDELAKNFPKDPGVPEANYKTIWCNFQLNKLSADSAKNAFLELYKKYPQDPQASLALFNAAEFSFNAGDFAGAQTDFEEETKVFPNGNLADEARYFAGRAAVERKDYNSALEILNNVKGGDAKIDARILQGHIYQLLGVGDYDKAINLFDEVLITEKSGPRFVEATLNKGHCLFAQGENDPIHFQEAAAAFRTIPDLNQGNPAQRNEAAYMRAKCIEKMDRQSEALALYLDVLNGQTMAPAGSDAAGGTGLPPEMYWRVQAGESAAELREKDKDWQGALAIYRKLEQIGGPLQEQFKNIISHLRRDHFLYDDDES